MDLFFNAITNFGTSRVMKVVVKFHRNCVCSFWEESKCIFWGVTPLSPETLLDPNFFFLMSWTNFSTSRVVKMVVKFNWNCMCSFGEESKYIFWAVPLKSPYSQIFLMSWTNFGMSWVLKVVVKFHRNCVYRLRRKQIPVWGGNPLPLP